MLALPLLQLSALLASPVRRALRAGALCAMLVSGTAMAQRAGSAVQNIASAEFQVDGTSTRITSNAATLQIAEVLDISLTVSGSAFPIDGPGSAVPFTLINAGNGDERFLLIGRLEAIAGQVRGFAVDRNGNGIFDAADTLLDGSTPPLAPGQTVALLAVLDPGQAAQGSALGIFARALTGSGAPGTVYSGGGELGSDAIVGATTAEATLRVTLVAGAAPGATLEKSQTVVAPDGSGMTVRGAIVTYAIVARFEGSGVARAIQVTDPVPSGTSYVAGSLTLDDRPLSDATDGDAGSADNGSVAVALGDIAGGAARTIRFKVKIK